MKHYVAVAVLRRLLAGKREDLCPECLNLLAVCRKEQILQPKRRFVNLFNKTTRTIHRLLINNYYRKGIRAMIKDYLLKNMARFGCANYDLRIQFIDLCVSCVFYSWWKTVNCILRGTGTRLIKESDAVQVLAFKYFKKFNEGKKLSVSYQCYKTLCRK